MGCAHLNKFNSVYLQGGFVEIWGMLIRLTKSLLWNKKQTQTHPWPVMLINELQKISEHIAFISTFWMPRFKVSCWLSAWPPVDFSAFLLPLLLSELCLCFAFLFFFNFPLSWLPPVSRQDGESMQEFANKVQEVKSDFVAKGIYLGLHW